MSNTEVVFEEVEELNDIVNLNNLTVPQLRQKCKELGLKGYSKMKKEELIELITNKNNNISDSESDTNSINEKKSIAKEDTYTKEVLQQCYNIHKEYVVKRKELAKNLCIKFRLPSIPEDISENIIKFIIHKNGDKSSSWLCGTGDLFSQVEGKQECKCFTSDGPISFTPSSMWNVIYFLDARDWLNDKFILYKVNLKKDSEEWKNIPMNKSQTFDDQCQQGRRPRINWNALQTHIEGHYEKIFDGTFEEIFI